MSLRKMARRFTISRNKRGSASISSSHSNAAKVSSSSSSSSSSLSSSSSSSAKAVAAREARRSSRLNKIRQQKKGGKLITAAASVSPPGDSASSLVESSSSSSSPSQSSLLASLSAPSAPLGSGLGLGLTAPPALLQTLAKEDVRGPLVPGTPATPINSGLIQKMRVKKLRDELAKRGLSVEGLKSELRDRLEAAVLREQNPTILAKDSRNSSFDRSYSESDTSQTLETSLNAIDAGNLGLLSPSSRSPMAYAQVTNQQSSGKKRHPLSKQSFAVPLAAPQGASMKRKASIAGGPCDERQKENEFNDSIESEGVFSPKRRRVHNGEHGAAVFASTLHKAGYVPVEIVEPRTFEELSSPQRRAKIEQVRAEALAVADEYARCADEYVQNENDRMLREVLGNSVSTPPRHGPSAAI